MRGCPLALLGWGPSIALDPPGGSVVDGAEAQALFLIGVAAVVEFDVEPVTGGDRLVDGSCEREFERGGCVGFDGPRRASGEWTMAGGARGRVMDDRASAARVGDGDVERPDADRLDVAGYVLGLADDDFLDG